MKRSPLRRVSKDPKRRAKRFIPHACLEALKIRSGGRCEHIMWINLLDIRCRKKASEPHHVLARSQGGDHSISNLLYICNTCHRDAHDNQRVAVEEGLIIPWKGYRHPADFQAYLTSKGLK